MQFQENLNVLAMMKLSCSIKWLEIVMTNYSTSDLCLTEHIADCDVVMDERRC